MARIVALIVAALALALSLRTSQSAPVSDPPPVLDDAAVLALAGATTAEVRRRWPQFELVRMRMEWTYRFPERELACTFAAPDGGPLQDQPTLWPLDRVMLIDPEQQRWEQLWWRHEGIVHLSPGARLSTIGTRYGLLLSALDQSGQVSHVTPGRLRWLIGDPDARTMAWQLEAPVPGRDGARYRLYFDRTYARGGTLLARAPCIGYDEEAGGGIELLQPSDPVDAAIWGRVIGR